MGASCIGNIISPYVGDIFRLLEDGILLDREIDFKIAK